eukprot:gene3921-7818_t
MDQTDQEENGKPRRLDEETAQYLIQLGNQLSSQKSDEIDGEVLVENVLNEIKTRTGSAASDRRTHEIIEKLCYLSTMKHLLEIIRRFSHYAVFLSENRFSAHVLQASMSKLCNIMKNGYGEEEESIVDTMQSLTNPIFGNLIHLMKETNGSHVMRSLISILTGIPVLAERKSKESKHQHSVPLSEPHDSVMSVKRFYVDKQRCFAVPEEFHEMLGTMAASLLTENAVELHHMVGSPSGCAVVGLLLRVLFAPDIIQGGPELADRLVRHTLCWDSSEGPEVLYAIAGDKSGSYFLETTLECCSIPLLRELHEKAFRGSTIEYSTDGSANFVIQAFLRRLCKSLEFISEEEEEENAACLVTMARESLQELTAGIHTLLATRGGVVLWMLETENALCPCLSSTSTSAAVKSRQRQKQNQHDSDDEEDDKEDKDTNKDTNNNSHVMAGVGKTLVTMWTTSTSTSASGHNETGDVLQSVDTATVIGRLSVYLEDLFVSGESGESSPKQLLIGRLIGAILRGGAISGVSPAQVECRTVVMSAICSLSAASLFALIRSGPMSRAVMDVVFDDIHGLGRQDETLPLLEKFIGTLLPRLSELAVHFVGHHVLRRIFLACGAVHRKQMARALLESKDKLQVSREGRNSLQTVQAELLAKDEGGWTAWAHRQRKGVQMLAELDKSKKNDSSSVQRKPVVSSGVGQDNNTRQQVSAVKPKTSMEEVDQGEEDQQEPEQGERRVRKRKRKHAKDSQQVEPTKPKPIPFPVPVAVQVPVLRASVSEVRPPIKVQRHATDNQNRADFSLVKKLSSGKGGIKQMEKELALLQKEKIEGR